MPVSPRQPRAGRRRDEPDLSQGALETVIAPVWGTFRRWLFSIAHNTVTDSYRASRPIWPLSFVADLLDRRPGVEEEVLDRVERDELYLLLRRLPKGQRQVMELRLAGITSAETAEILGRSLGSIKIAQVRAVEKLRELLGVTIEPDVTELQEIPNAAPR